MLGGAAHSRSTLNFYLQVIDLRVPDVLDRMRRQRFEPSGCIEVRCVYGLTRVDRHVAKMVAPDEIAPGEDEQNARPAVSMHRNSLPRQDARFENAYALVLKQERVVLRRGDQSI